MFGKGEDALLTPDVIYAMKQGKVAAAAMKYFVPCKLAHAFSMSLCSSKPPS